MNLIAFESRFQTTCCSRSGSPRTTKRPGVDVGLDADALGICRRPQRLDAGAHERHQIDVADLEPQLAGDRLRDVEQVVDQTRLRARVAIDGLDRGLTAPIVELAGGEHVRPALDRGQRRAQLVRERHQELVLQRARGFGVAPGPPLALERLGEPLVHFAQPAGLVVARLGQRLLRDPLGVHLAEEDDQPAGQQRGESEEEQRRGA